MKKDKKAGKCDKKIKNPKQEESHEVAPPQVTKKMILPKRHWFFNFGSLMFWACVIRFGFMVANEMFDIATDIDYHVYTEGARELTKEGGNPYHRFTYRYTPLLAYMMLPNLQIPFYGKFIFNVFDLLSIVYMNLFLSSIKEIDSITKYKSLAFWALNPLMVIINGRGSCESISLFFLTGMLYHLKLSREGVAKIVNISVAGVYYGLLVHFRLYPVIFGLTLYIWINKERVLPRFYVIFFGIVSVGLNVILILMFYAKFGQIFLDECFLYHLKRKDPRHNYSIFWVNTVYDYFLPESEIPVPSFGKFLLAGRLLLIVIVALVFWRRRILALTIQTFIFTTFNTVYTAQYAIWETQLLPYVLVDSDCFGRNKKMGFWLLILIWLGNLEFWDIMSGKFEHGGINTQYWMHFANLGYFLIRVLFIQYVVENRKDHLDI